MHIRAGLEPDLIGKMSIHEAPKGHRIRGHLAAVGAVGAVLLAAGRGSRMGNRPKSLLQLDGVPLIQRQLIALSGAGIDEVVVVLGHYAQHIEPAIAGFPVTLVRNPQPDDGQVSSQRLGLAALSPTLDAVVVALADQPLINAQDVIDLMAAYQQRPPVTEVVVPLVQGLPGNPVMFSRHVKEAILMGVGQLGCKQWQTQHPQHVHTWETANPHYRQDVDSPQDLQALAQRSGHRLTWPASLALG